MNCCRWSRRKSDVLWTTPESVEVYNWSALAVTDVLESIYGVGNALHNLKGSSPRPMEFASHAPLGDRRM